MPGVIEIVASASIGKAVDDLALILECLTDGELENRVLYVPLSGGYPTGRSTTPPLPICSPLSFSFGGDRNTVGLFVTKVIT